MGLLGLSGLIDSGGSVEKSADYADCMLRVGMSEFLSSFTLCFFTTKNTKTQNLKNQKRPMLSDS